MMTFLLHYSNLDNVVPFKMKASKKQRVQSCTLKMLNDLKILHKNSFNFKFLKIL